jgi:hypothetical protein
MATNRGSLATPPRPLFVRPRGTPAPVPDGAQRGKSKGVGLAATSTPAPCITRCDASRMGLPAPVVRVGQGATVLSDQCLQLVFVQLDPALPL